MTIKNVNIKELKPYKNNPRKNDEAVEYVAEAFADVYCNGAKAAAESKAIVNVLNSYL